MPPVHDKKKKLLHVFNAIEYSGAEKMIFSLRKFYQENFEVYALNTAEKKGDFFNGFSEEFSTHQLVIPLKRNLGYFFSLFRFAAFYRRTGIDILHIHPNKRFLFHVLSGKLGGVGRIIRQVHNNFIFAGRIKTKEKAIRHLAKFLGVEIVAISKSVAMNEWDEFGIETKTINNFYDDAVYFPPSDDQEKNKIRQTLNVKANSFCIVSVGSCIERKQHDHIIQMVSNLVGSGRQVTYLHIGEGPLCEQEKGLVNALGLEEIVHFVTQRPDLRNHLIASDLFVMTSKVEGSSIALLEAMACSTATLTYNNPGLTEYAMPDGPGLICNSDSDSLFRSVSKIAENPEQLKDISRQCLQYVEMNHNKHSIEKEWLTVYLNN